MSDHVDSLERRMFIRDSTEFIKVIYRANEIK